MDKNRQLAAEIVRVLEKRCKAGCHSPTWIGYENGNGSECGREIERLIRRAKRLLNSSNRKEPPPV